MYPPRPENRIHLLVVYLLVVLAFIGGALMDQLGWLPGSAPPAPGLKQTFAEAWNLVDKDYVDRKAVKHDRMTKGAINGMLDSLGDKGHTTYLTKEEAEGLQKQLKGNIEGIGVRLDRTKPVPTILQVLPGSPAQKAGLKEGDVILEVNDNKVARLPHEKIVDMIRDPAHPVVKLLVQRPGVIAPVTLEIKRGKVDFPTVTWNLLPGTAIAHIFIQEFGNNTDTQLRTAIQQAYHKGAKGLIIDLRYNAGGLKDKAIAVTSEFLARGVVFIERNAAGDETPIPVRPGGIAATVPLVLLINEKSASSSEILAGALKDHERAPLVGTKTFGTGTVLRPCVLSDGSMVLLAVAEWLTPKGHQIWHKGIEPDYDVSLPPNVFPLFPFEQAKLDAKALRQTKDKQLLKALEVLEEGRPGRPAAGPGTGRRP